VHQFVSHVPVPLMSHESVAALPVTGSVDTVRGAMARLCSSAHVPDPSAEALPR
jgi:hypothetical protein